jgi:hypothetical protein
MAPIHDGDRGGPGVTYLEALSAELARVGIRGRLRRRILAELGDHLACDPDAALGEPREIASRFADELGTARARRAAFAAFSVLALAAAALAASWLGSRATGLAWPRVHAPSRVVTDLGFVLVAVCPQVALVSGVLAAVRALRRRGALVVPRAEATVMARRAIVALAAGVASMAGLALLALEFHRSQPTWWLPATLAGAGAAACALLATVPAAFAALRVRPVARGGSGDLFADLGALAPPALRGRPWAFALTVAAGLAVLVTVAGVLQADPYDGALRGFAEGGACLVGFALLGRYLGLRPTRGTARGR